MIYDETPKRFDRIVAILIQLQSKRIVKAHEMANRFGVSLRTIYRDIRTLEVCGVPVYSEAGVGYSLMEGYRLPPVMFSKEEVTTFIAAAHLVSQFTDPVMRTHFEGALFKLKAVLQMEDRDMLSEIEPRISAKRLANVPTPPDNALGAILQSIGERRKLKLQYQAMTAEHPTERLIEPVALVHEHQSWYVHAYCHLRQEYRQFRADRILHFQLTTDPFDHSHHDPSEWAPEEIPLTEVEIRVERRVAKYLQYERHYYGFVGEHDDGDFVRMIFRCRQPEQGLGRWFMMFADCADIVRPDSLRAFVTGLLDKSLQRSKSRLSPGL